MAESFGARLRRQREERGIDLLAIAEQTKIKISLLEGLERDDVSRWPSGIFRRAYIRSYAHSIGLDSDAVLREFLECHPEQDDLFASLAPPPTPGAAPGNDAPPTRLRTILDSAIASLGKLRQPGAVAPVPATTRSGADLSRPAAPSPAAEEPSTGPVDLEPLGARDTSPPPQPIRTEQDQIRRVRPPADVAPLTVDEELLDRESEAGFAEPDARAAEPGSAGTVRADASIRREETVHRSGSDDRTARLPYDDGAAFEDVARLCTAFGRISDGAQFQEFLQESARVLTATGLIVWCWDEASEVLRPAVAHGYSARILAHLPVLTRDADNATAAAFRSANACDVSATADTSGALVVPLLSCGDCLGALAIELQRGVQPTRFVRTAATVLAALLSPLVHRRPSTQQRHAVERNVPGAIERRSSTARRLTY